MHRQNNDELDTKTSTLFLHVDKLELFIVISFTDIDTFSLFNFIAVSTGKSQKNFLDNFDKFLQSLLLTRAFKLFNICFTVELNYSVNLANKLLLSLLW